MRNVVPSWFAGVFCLRGVGDGERDGDERFLEGRGVACVFSVPGVRERSPRLVGLCPSFAHKVISGTSEKALKHVSSMVLDSCACVCEARRSRPACSEDVACEVVVIISTRSTEVDELPRLCSGRGVLAALRDGFRGDLLLGVRRVEGGGIKSESLLPLRFSVPGTGGHEPVPIAVPVCLSSGVAGLCDDGTRLCVLRAGAGVFSLSSVQSPAAACDGFLGVA